MADQIYDTSLAAEFPANPAYGTGCFRRKIHLINQPGRVVAALEDDCHGFRVTLHHDGATVTEVEAETLRIPFDTCPGAIEPIKALSGIALGSEPKTITTQVSPFSNCTHLFDLSVLAISHASRAGARAPV